MNLLALFSESEIDYIEPQDKGPGIQKAGWAQPLSHSEVCAIMTFMPRCLVAYCGWDIVDMILTHQDLLAEGPNVLDVLT